jgi:hypothetical protein
VKTINYKGTGILNASKQEANPKEQDLSVAFFLDWKQKHPVAYDIISETLADDVIFFVIAQYMTIQHKKADTLTSFDKKILKVIAHFELLNVLMDKKSNDEKHAALSKWQATLLEIVGNDCTEILQIGCVTGDTAAHIEVNHKVKAFDERNANLKKGRFKGARRQKEHSEKIDKLILTINSDLLNHPHSARWTLDQRADYIEKDLSKKKIKQINGEPYLFSTIRKKITGKR